MSLTRRLFLRNTAAASAICVVPVTAASVASPAPEPVRSPKEQAIWHLRELERLVKADGASRYVVTVVGNGYGDHRRAQTIQITQEGFFDEGVGEMFAGDA